MLSIEAVMTNNLPFSFEKPIQPKDLEALATFIEILRVAIYSRALTPFSSAAQSIVSLMNWPTSAS
ncbi:hypothetical protein [Pedobacter xixiisoli]|uniref:Uncharacterized protein n=1 Tax=Pedobacter xixiisoli TaxID=1476464 RepID=A0A286A0G3_9SPHI|nr:hypothetical protein [Pedobacter xixiisoli]SOD15394.1 hypothetical protein SAMN06297358_2386 [Pedobacter xixiisoli]